MELHLDQAGVFSLRLTCVFVKKTVSFRAVELGLRMPQVVPEAVGKQSVHVPDLQLHESRTGQQIVFPVKEGSVEVIQVISQEPVVSQGRVQERIVEQLVDIAVPPVKEELVGAAAFTSRAHPRAHRQAGGDCPSPPDSEGFVEAVQFAPQEHIQERMDVNISVPRAMEERVEGVLFTPQERLQERMVEQTVNIPVPSIKEDFTAVVQPPQEYVQERIVVQSFDIFVP